MAYSASYVYGNSAANSVPHGGTGVWTNPNWSAATGSWINGSPGSSGQAGSAGSTYGSGLDDLMRQINQINQSNNAWSAQQAQRQMDFQADQAKLLREFNSGEAEKDRLWQQYMSDTAHQREVKDLAAAGLNPVLAANSGAAVTSGATAAGYSPPQGAKGDTDMSGSSALASIFGSLLQAQTTLTSQALSAQNNLAVAEKYTSMQQSVANIQRQTALDTSSISAMASRYAADVHADASKVSAAISAAATRYAADQHLTASELSAQLGYQASIYGTSQYTSTNRFIAGFNAEVNKELKQMDIDAQFDFAREFPSSMFGFLSSLAGEFDIGSYSNDGLSAVGNLYRQLLKSTGLFPRNITGKFGS